MRTITRTASSETADLNNLRGDGFYCYVGSGLSAAAGMITWGQMIRCIMQLRAKETKSVTPMEPQGETAVAYSEYMEKWLHERSDPLGSDDDKANPRILSRQSTDNRTFRRVALLNLMFRYAKGYDGILPNSPDLGFHRLLWRANCLGAITSNYDTCLENAFAGHSPLASANPSFLRVYRYDAEFMEYLFTNPSFVVKLHGDVNDIGSMLLDPEAAWEDRSRFESQQGHRLKEIYCKARCLGHFVFLGAGMRDRTIIELQREWNKRPELHSGNKCFALVPESDLPLIEKELVEAGIRNPGDFFGDVQFHTYEWSNSSVTQSTMLRTYLNRLAKARTSSSSARSKKVNCRLEEQNLKRKEQASSLSSAFQSWVMT